MGFQDVAILPSTASSSTISHEKCGGGDRLRTTTCLKMWLVVNKGMLQ